MSSSLRVINNRYIIDGGWAAEARERVGGLERDAAGDARGPQLISVPRKEGGERGGGGGRSPGRGGRGSDLHKYIEFIEMSLGIAARRILAAYQPPRRFIPSALAPLSRSRTLTSSPLFSPLSSSPSSPPPPPSLLPPSSSLSSSLAFIKIAGLIYAAR